MNPNADNGNPHPPPGPGQLDRGQRHSAGTPPVQLAKFLVPLDFSPCSIRGLDYALTLAEKFNAKLTLFHVVEPAAPPSLDSDNQNLLEISVERLNELARKHCIAGIPRIETLARLGHAHSEIPDTAKALGADLIVIATHGHNRLRQAMMGSTAERVTRTAPCPVLIIRPLGLESC